MSAFHLSSICLLLYLLSTVHSKDTLTYKEIRNNLFLNLSDKGLGTQGPSFPKQQAPMRNTLYEISYSQNQKGINKAVSNTLCC